MRQYKLLKDLPTIEAGRIFEETKGSLGGTLLYATGFCSGFTIDKDGIQNFDEWFEEIKEPELPEEFFYINIDMVTGYSYSYFSMDENTRQEYIRFTERYKSVGNFFETEEEAEKHLKYLQAKEVIKQDTKGFIPDWNDKDEVKYWGEWVFKDNELRIISARSLKNTTLFFRSIKDIEKSFAKHPDEWKTYLTYEQ